MTLPQRRGTARPSSDPEILQRIASGEIGALGELYDRHREPLRRFIARATCDSDDVDDLVQMAFLEAAKSAARFDGRASSRPWLIGIAVRLLRRRRHGLARLFAFFSTLGATQGRKNDPRSALDTRNDVDRALGALSESKRITLLLAEVEGMSCAEIAEALAIPIGTVWTRLHAARRELRSALEPGDER